MSRETKSFLANLITAAVLIGITAAMMLWWLNLYTDPAIIDGLAPCPTEDSSNCYWDSTVRGTGEGLSFADIDGTLILWCTEALVETGEACWGPIR